MKSYYWLLIVFLVMLGGASVATILQKRLKATDKRAILGIAIGGGLMVANAFPKAPETLLWIGAILMTAGIVGIIRSMDIL